MACAIVNSVNNKKLRLFVHSLPFLFLENVEYFNLNCLEMAMKAESFKFVKI